MRVLVVHASRLGSTREIADRIAMRLDGLGVHATSMPADGPADPATYDAVVIGSGVYGGHWIPSAVDFARRFRHTLAARPVWLFSSGPVGAKAVTHTPGVPKEIAELSAFIEPRGHRVFAGSLDRSRVDDAGFSLGERFIAKRLVPEGDFRAWNEIAAWADSIATDLGSSIPVA